MTPPVDGSGSVPEPEFDANLHCCGHRWPAPALRLGACAGAVEHAGPHTYWTADNVGRKGVVNLYQPHEDGGLEQIMHADFRGDVEADGYAFAAALVAVRYSLKAREARDA